MPQPLQKTVRQLFKKLNIELLYDQAITLLGIHPKGLNIGTQIRHCTPVFTAALFIVARKWTPPECLSSNKWKDKIRHIHTMGYYSAIKRVKVQYATT